MTVEEFANRLERFERGMDALQAELKRVAAERDALRKEVARLREGVSEMSRLVSRYILTEGIAGVPPPSEGDAADSSPSRP